MATKLAETYFRIAITLDIPDQEKLEHRLDAIAADVARGLFHQKVEVVSYVVSGSIRGWIVAAGSIALAVEHYGGLRDGVDYLIRDARTFSEQLLTVVEDSEVPPGKIVRTERRLVIPGKVKRLLRELDGLKSEGRDLSKTEYDSRIESIKQKVLIILRDVGDEKDRAVLVESLPNSVRSGLPARLPAPKDDMKVALRPEEYDGLTYKIPLLADGGGARRMTGPAAGVPFEYDRRYALEIVPNGFKFRIK